jgi:hypothetical protein
VGYIALTPLYKWFQPFKIGLFSEAHFLSAIKRSQHAFKSHYPIDFHTPELWSNSPKEKINGLNRY